MCYLPQKYSIQANKKFQISNSKFQKDQNSKSKLFYLKSHFSETNQFLRNLGFGLSLKSIADSFKVYFSTWLKVLFNVYLCSNLELVYIMIKVSENAKSRITQLMAESGFEIAQDFVRVGVKSGGCSGLSYELNFDKQLGENDKLFEDLGVKIAVDKKSFLYLVGTTLEYSGGLNGKGFVFQNPNANRTCGCGESFSL